MLSERNAPLVKSVNGPPVFSVKSECHRQTHRSCVPLPWFSPTLLSTSYFSQPKTLAPEQSMPLVVSAPSLPPPPSPWAFPASSSRHRISWRPWLSIVQPVLLRQLTLSWALVGSSGSPASAQTHMQDLPWPDTLGELHAQGNPKSAVWRSLILPSVPHSDWRSPLNKMTSLFSLLDFALLGICDPIISIFADLENSI